jgi:predicted nuclease of predicted toxin-antitoxin system
VKLLFDENRSRRLVARLEDLFPGSEHVANAKLIQASDLEIWQHAKSHGFAIATADADFYELATTLGPPPKVIWLRGCDYPTSEVERLIRSQVLKIVRFLEDAERAVLVLRAR